ncbi:MAG TPA: primosomal protein N', partial [Acidobacteriaceae bacterium]
MSTFCEVALPVPLDRTFTYTPGHHAAPLPGSRVVVPFRNEKLVGVVTELHSREPQDFEAKQIESILDAEPLLSPHLLEIAAWMAQYYIAPIGEVLRGMLPLSAEVRNVVYYRITNAGRDALAAAHDGQPAIFGKTPSQRRQPKLSGEEQSVEHRILTHLAGGEPVKLGALRTATAATLSQLNTLLRRKWISRESSVIERDAQRKERFAVL